MAIESVLLRKLQCWTALQVACLCVVTVGFMLFPPLHNVNTVTDTMGYLDKALRVLPDQLRMLVFFALAALACLRFDPLKLPGLLLYAHVALMCVAHVGWDKYALPLIAVLWLLFGANWPTLANQSDSDQPQRG